MIKSLIYKILIISVFVNGCKAQTYNNTLKGINKDIETLNLKGPVKEIKSVVTTNNEDQYSIQNMLLFNSDFRNDGMVLYQNGLLYKEYIRFIEFDYKNNVYRLPSQNHIKVIDTIKMLSHIVTTEDRFSGKILYDSIDLKDKMKFQPKYSFVEHFGESNLEQDIYKLFVNYFRIDRFEETLNILYYNYDIDTKGRIKTRKHYSIGFYDCVNYKDSISKFQKEPFKYLTDEDLKYNWDYYYDDKDRITKLVLTNVKVENERDKVMNTRNKLIYDFEYNDKNKVNELKISSTGTKSPEPIPNKKYKYEYHPTENYLISKEIVLDSIYFYKYHDGGSNEYTDIHSKIHYNEHGDIIKREFLSERSQLINAQKDPHEEWWRNPFAPRYYEYEYDQFNNWIKCTAYLRGVKTPKPSLVIEREITYYED